MPYLAYHSTSIVCSCYGSEALLASSVPKQGTDFLSESGRSSAHSLHGTKTDNEPDLQSDFLAIQLDRSNLEVDAYITAALTNQGVESANTEASGRHLSSR